MDADRLASRAVALLTERYHEPVGEQLWVLVERQMEQNELGRAVLSRLRAHPQDLGLARALEVALLETLQDSGFARQLAGELDRADAAQDAREHEPSTSQSSVATGNTIAVGGDVRRSQIALGSITNSRRVRISLGLGLPLLIIVVLLLANRGSDSDDGNEAETASPSAAGGEAAATSGGPLVVFPDVASNRAICARTGPGPEEQISLVHNGALFLVSPAGGTAACLTYPVTDLQEWSADGTALLADYQVNYFDAPNSVAFHDPDRGDGAVALFPPSGDYVFVANSVDGVQQIPTGEPDDPDGRLTQMDIRPTGDLAFSPEGTWLAVVGHEFDAPETYGIWVRSTDRDAPEQLVEASAVQDGSGGTSYGPVTMDFLDEHTLAYVTAPLDGGQLTVGAVDTESGRSSPIGEIPTNAMGTSGSLVVQASTDRLAIGIGACFDYADTYIAPLDAGPIIPIELDGYRFVQPAGWLSDGRLLLLARPDACNGPADAVLWDDEGDPVLLATGVEAALIRPAA